MSIFRSDVLALLAVLIPAASGAQDWPRTITYQTTGDTQAEITLDAPPQRIVSTAPSLTGILLAIDAPLVATATAVKGPLTDDTGFFRQWADVAHARGVEVLYTNLTFDIEALIVSEPDLVVASSTGGDSILPYLTELRAQDIPVLVLDYSSHGWEDLAEMLGRATGHEADADRAIADFDARAAKVADELRPPEGTVSIVSYDFAGTYAVGKPTSPQAKVVAALGFTVSGLPDAMRSQVARSSDFDFVSHENLAPAITGDTVFLLSGTKDSVKAFQADPVLANLPAVKSRRVYPLGPTSFRVDYYSGLQIIETLQPYFTP